MDAGVSCHPSMNVNMTTTATSTHPQPSRVLVAHSASIPAHQTILRMYKPFTIWYVDAIQDPWIHEHVVVPQQQEQLQIRNAAAAAIETPLSAAAYLSIYIGRWMFHHYQPPS